MTNYGVGALMFDASGLMPEADAPGYANDFVSAPKSDKPAGCGLSSKGHTYFTVTKKTIGFREAAQLVETAAKTGSVIKLVAGSKSASTDSILSIIKLNIIAGMSVGLGITCKDGTNDAAARFVYEECRRVFNNR